MDDIEYSIVFHEFSKIAEKSAKLDYDCGWTESDQMQTYCIEGNAIKVEECLRNGANANFIDMRGNTGLLYAACFGHMNIVATLLALMSKDAILSKNLVGQDAITMASLNAGCEGFDGVNECVGMIRSKLEKDELMGDSLATDEAIPRCTSRRI